MADLLVQELIQNELEYFDEIVTYKLLRLVKCQINIVSLVKEIKMRL